jgi:hypothetical protein
MNMDQTGSPSLAQATLESAAIRAVMAGFKIMLMMQFPKLFLQKKVSSAALSG